jgi:uncharacterized Tic20 family protein
MFCSSCGTEVPDAAIFCQKCGANTGTGSPAASAGGFSAPAAPAAASADSDKLMVIVAHLGGIFFGFIPSLVVFLIKKDSPGWVLDSAREALNWQITVLIAAVVCTVLMFVLIGIFLFWALMLTNLVLCILAAVKTSSRQAYRYPFCLRLLK